jgi:hypothetical protein
MFKALRINKRKQLYRVECEMHFNDNPVRRFEVLVKAHSKWHAKRIVKEELTIKPVKTWKMKK